MEYMRKITAIARQEIKKQRAFVGSQRQLQVYCDAKDEMVKAAKRAEAIMEDLKKLIQSAEEADAEVLVCCMKVREAFEAEEEEESDSIPGSPIHIAAFEGPQIDIAVWPDYPA